VSGTPSTRSKSPALLGSGRHESDARRGDAPLAAAQRDRPPGGVRGDPASDLDGEAALAIGGVGESGKLGGNPGLAVERAVQKVSQLTRVRAGAGFRLLGHRSAAASCRLSRSRSVPAESACRSRSGMQNEFSALQSEITRIAMSTKFGGAVLLDGSLSGSGNALQVQVEIFNNAAVDGISLEIGNATASGLNIHAGAATIASADGAQSALATIDSAIASVARLRGDLGAAQNRLQSTINNSTA
jgi:hypothetical protein